MYQPAGTLELVEGDYATLARACAKTTHSFTCPILKHPYCMNSVVHSDSFEKNSLESIVL